MAELLQDRLDKVFQNLCTSSEQAPTQWRPSPVNVVRNGDQMSALVDDETEIQEALQQQTAGVMMDFITEEEDAPNEEGLRPSAAFMQQLDREEDLDEVDLTAAAPDEARPAPCTTVLDNNIYDQRLSLVSVPDTSMDDDDDDDAAPDIAQHLSSSPLQRRLSSGSLKPNLKIGVVARPIMKKRVSFSGIPEPWVPPHKRVNYIATKFPKGSGEEALLPPSPSVVVAAAAAADPGGTVLPDYVVNKHRYTRYEFDEPVVVGGGVGQLGSGSGGSNRLEDDDEEGQRAVRDTMGMAAKTIRDGSSGEIPQNQQQQQQQVDEEEESEKRWQGEVGGGIEFRPRSGDGGQGERIGRGKKGTVVAPPVAVSFKIDDDDDGDELM